MTIAPAPLSSRNHPAGLSFEKWSNEQMAGAGALDFNIGRSFAIPFGVLSAVRGTRVNGSSDDFPFSTLSTAYLVVEFSLMATMLAGTWTPKCF
jgi:hypothetical protein